MARPHPEDLAVLRRAGLLSPGAFGGLRPDRWVGVGLAAARWGTTFATGVAVGASRHPDRPAVVDDDGTLTWRELDRRTTQVAAGLLAAGLQPGDRIGVLARNGRGFVLPVVAAGMAGLDVVHLSTGAAPGLMAQACARERVALVVVDDDDPDPLALPPGVSARSLGDLPVGPAPLRATRPSRQVVLTSGTTGVPRGAARAAAGLPELVAALDRIPLRAGGVTALPAPLFHAWGLGHLALALVLGSTLLLSRRFDPVRLVAALDEHQADALVLVPVMLDRLLPAVDRPLPRLRVVASSGSALPGDLAVRCQAVLGPVLHSLYGSTEVAYAAVATPEDLAADPRTAGRAPRGVALRVVDEAGGDCPPGVTGRVFVGSGLTFRGYTDGSDRDRLDGLVATGDLGVWDEAGRLRVLGRTDDMVVVGGENVVLGAVEEALLLHPAVAEACVVDEDDPAYGVRLVAHVVPVPGSAADMLEGSGSAAAPEVLVTQLADLVRGQVARHAVPREVVVRRALPRNVTGKVLRRELRGAR